jgi:hypothetical protein
MADNLSIQIDHRMTKADVIAKLQGFMDQVIADYAGMVKDLQESWEGNTNTFSFTVMGQSVTGTLEVTDSHIIIQGNNVPFASMVEEAIRYHVKEALS